MANFNTHLGVAALGSGMLSTLCLQVGFVGSSDAILLAVAGTAGGILPDIDLHYSHPSKILFNVLGIVFAFLWVFAATNNLSISELWIAGLGIFLFIRYPLWALFNKYTTHRGAVHSLLTATLSGVLTALLCFQLFGKSAFVSWLVGFFVFSGFVLHLLLDELYSVDFTGRRIKRSFGTALKLVDKQQWRSSLIIALLTIACLFFTPPIKRFFDTVLSAETYQVIQHRFLPR